MNTKLKCLLLDDELVGLAYLKMLCEQIREVEVVKVFNRPETFLAEAPGLVYDLCILDIEMPGVNGLQITNLLNGKPVIFTTAYDEYAAEAFDLNAVDYVRKPIKKERLQQAIIKAINKVWNKHEEKQFVQLRTDKGNSLILPDQLCYIKTSDIDSRDKIACLLDGSTMVLKNVSFGKLQLLLPQRDYCRINRKEMIALKSVKHFSYDEISTNIPTVSGKPLTLALGEVYRKEFIQKVNI